MQIRRTADRDRPALLRLWREAFSEENPAYYQQEHVDYEQHRRNVPAVEPVEGYGYTGRPSGQQAQGKDEKLYDKGVEHAAREYLNYR